MIQEVGRFNFAFYTASGRSFGNKYQEYVDNTIEQFFTVGHAREMESLKKYEINKPAFFLEQESHARKFMNVFGFSDLPDVHIVCDDPEDVFGFLDTPTTVAMAPTYLDAVICRDARLAETDMYQHPHHLAKTLVHEFSHTAMPRESIGVQADTAAKEGRIHGRCGFNVLTTQEWEGNFFEESFAEYMASRYMRMTVGDMRPIGIDGPPSVELPDYFMPPDSEMLSGYDGYVMELISYGAEKMNIMGSDLFADLLLDTRREATQGAALRTFAQVVESIQPGLYLMLRRLQYDKTNWQLACSYVHNLVVKL